MRSCLKIRVAAQCLPIALALLVSSVMPCSAQTRDFSNGFQKFYTLGLPDVKDAQYVELEMYGNEPFRLAERSLYDLDLKGNAWLLKENKEGPSLFVVGGCRLVEVYDIKWLEKERKEETKDEARVSRRHYGARWNQDDERTPGKWKKVEPEQDLKKILAYLDKQAENPEENRWSFQSGGYGELFLSAIHFHRNGHAEEGNRIVEQLFNLAEDRRQVLFQSLNILGDARYHAAYDAFKKSGDWTAFAKELDDLTGLFVTGWKMCPAIQQLAAKIKQRSTMTSPPAVSGEGLTDEDKALAAELAAAPDSRQLGYMNTYSSLWILRPASSQLSEEDKDKHVITRITERGMKSVPLLMALVKDEYLTRIDRQSLGSHYYSSRSYSDELMSEEHVRQLYNSIPRPAARSELAIHLLEPLLPRDDESRHITDQAEDPDAFLQECKAWHKTHKDMSSLDLARAYLKDGNNPQQEAAIRFLIAKGNDADMTAIEEYFLSAERPVYGSGMVHQYVSLRAEKAKDFVEKYEAFLKERKTEEGEDFGGEEHFDKMIERNISALKKLVSSQPASEILDEIVTGKKKLQEADGLPPKLAREPRDKAMAMLLEAALKAEDPETSSELAGYCFYVPYLAQQYSQFDPMSEEAEPEEEEPYDIRTHAELWKKLLSDTREIKPEHASARKTTVAEHTAWAIETLCLGDDANAARRTYGLLGERLADLILSRAKARLEGKDEDQLPAMPDPDNISAEARGQLANRILKTKPAELNTLVSGLNTDQLLALVEMGADNKELNRQLSSIANRIREVHWEYKAPGDDFTKLKGSLIHADTVEKFVALCKTAAAEGRLLVCSLSRKPCLAGTVLTVRHVLPDSEEFKQWKERMTISGEEGAKARVDANVSAPKLFARTSWLIESQPSETTPAGKTAEQPPDEETDLLDEMEDELENEMSDRLAESQKEFWGKIEEFCKGEENASSYASIAVWGTPLIEGQEETDPNAKKEQQEEGAGS